MTIFPGVLARVPHTKLDIVPHLVAMGRPGKYQSVVVRWSSLCRRGECDSVGALTTHGDLAEKNRQCEVPDPAVVGDG